MDISTVCPLALFDAFAAATSFEDIMRCFEHLCIAMQLDKTDHTAFYRRFGLL